MALVNCPECNKEISDKAKECPHCGYNIKKYLSNKKLKEKLNIKKLLPIIIVLVLCIVLFGAVMIIGRGSIKTAYNIIKTGSFECIQAHDLDIATCQHGQICKVCGSEIGEIVDHKWSEATCQHGKLCIFCNLEEGDKIDHEWLKATCTKGKTCTMCQMTTGSPLGHTTRQGYCGNCNEYIGELQDTYDYLISSIDEAWKLIDESMETMKLTTSFYDTTYVAESNEIDYEIQELLYEAANVAYQYDEFFDIGKDLQMAGAKLYLFDTLTSTTNFGSYTFMTSMIESIADCSESLGEAQDALYKMGK